GRGPLQRPRAHAQGQGPVLDADPLAPLAQELEPAVPHDRGPADLAPPVRRRRRRDRLRTVRTGHAHRHGNESARVPHRAGSRPHPGAPRHLRQPRGGRPLPRHRPQDQVMATTIATAPSSSGTTVTAPPPKARRLPIIRWASILILLAALI